jgi:hypothetical protein
MIKIKKKTNKEKDPYADLKKKLNAYGKKVEKKEVA